MIDEMSCVHILANDLNVVLFISQAGMSGAETTFTFQGTMFSVFRLLWLLSSHPHHCRHCFLIPPPVKFLVEI